jgi:hypothetical protein
MVAELLAVSGRETAWREAEIAADKFVFPIGSVERDAVEFVGKRSLSEIVSNRQHMLGVDRFNSTRCAAMFSDDPEFETLLRLATNGAVIDTGPDFVVNRRPEPFRRLQGIIPHTFMWHAHQLWLTGQALLIPVAVAETLTLHYNPIHWTPKVGKPIGRFLGDLSNTKSGSVLNNDGAKEAIQKRYGTVTLPTIRDIVLGILRVAQRSGGLCNVLLWKEDVVTAFNQFNFSSDSVHLIAFKVAQDAVLIPFTGIFGWQGSPPVFGVIARAIDRVIKARIGGEAEIYVDDIMGASAAVDATGDQEIARNVVTSTFGPSSINRDKSVNPCRVCEDIGWVIDLNLEVVYPNQKGIRKLITCFFSVDVHKRISQHQFQVMASLACRYSLALEGTRPFVGVFFSGVSCKQGLYPTSEVKLAIIVWRAVALVALNKPLHLAMPLMSFVDPPAIDVVLTSDAGPEGLGVMLTSVQGGLLAFASYKMPFESRESKYQNVREFCGAICGMLLISIVAPACKHIGWYGDNVSSLKWVRANMSSSKAAQAAFTLFSWLQIRTGVRFTFADHIAGTMMISNQVDSLSRFKPTSLDVRLDQSVLLNNKITDDLFTLCDPTVTDRTLVMAEKLMVDIIAITQQWCLECGNPG